MNNSTYAFLEEIFFNEHPTSRFFASDFAFTVDNIQKPTDITQSYPLPLEMTYLKEITLNDHKFNKLNRTNFKNNNQPHIQKLIYRPYLRKDLRFIVFILTYFSFNDAYRCTGVLIKPNWVMTSAYCVSHRRIWARNLVVALPKYSNIRFYLAYRLITPFDKAVHTSVVQERRVAYYRVNPIFDRLRALYDVALLKLRQPFNYPLAFGILSLEKMKNKIDHCIIIGFGLLYSNYSRVDGKIRILPNITISNPEIGCQNQEKKGPVICYQHNFGQEICQGDFGVPLICKGEIWGIASRHVRNYLSLNDYRCHGDSELYFTEIYSQLQWIQPIISKAVTSFQKKKKWYLAVFSFFIGLLVF